MKTFVSIFFYSSLLLSDPGEELQDGSCHLGVGKQRLSDFRQDPSWCALCLAWPSWRGYSGRIPSLQGGVWGAQTQRESRESRRRRSWSKISHTLRQDRVDLNSSLSCQKLHHSIRCDIKLSLRSVSHIPCLYMSKFALCFHTAGVSVFTLQL